MLDRKLIALGAVCAALAVGCALPTASTTGGEKTLSSAKRKTGKVITPDGSTVDDDGQQQGDESDADTDPATDGDTTATSSTGAGDSPASGTTDATETYFAQVLLESGAAAGAGLAVKGFIADEAEPTAAFKETTTDAKGRFELKDPSGKALNLEVVSGALKAMKLNVAANAEKQSLRLAATGTVKGVVSTPNAPGATRSGVKVYIPGTLYQATTGADGAYAIAGVPVGTYTVSAKSATLGTANANAVAVSSGAEATADLALSVFAPSIAAGGLSPASGARGTTVTVTGANFGHGDGKAYSVTVGGVAATANRTSDTRLTVQIPGDAPDGALVVTVGGLASNAATFGLIDSIAIAPADVTRIFETFTQAYSATAKDPAGNAIANAAIAWSSEDTAIATVDASGTVTGESAGTVSIFAQNGNVTGALRLTVDPLKAVVSTLAGGAEEAHVNGVGPDARFMRPTGLAYDGADNLYVVDVWDHRIRKVAPSLAVTDFAGTGAKGRNDGAAAGATFNHPRAIAIDDDDNLYITDQGNNMIRKITPGGTVSTLAGAYVAPTTGTDGVGDYAEGTGGDARFYWPDGIVYDGGDLYVADARNHLIRQVDDVTGETRLFAGVYSRPDPAQPPVGGYQDGPAAEARFNMPTGVARDEDGNTYVADFGNHVIRRIDATGTVTTIAGNAGQSGLADGMGAVVRLNGPRTLLYDGGILYFVDFANVAIRQLDLATGEVSTLAGGGDPGFADGPDTVARFNNPYQLVMSPDGELIVADWHNHRLRKIELR